MIQFQIFPGGKRRAVTFSYDDGHPNDARLVGLLNKYGIKATFHLNGKSFRDADDETVAALRARYAGHEIASHTLNHSWPSRQAAPSLLGEVLEDRRILERIAGYPVVGFSYPCCSYGADTAATLRAAGILYARTVSATDDFDFPRDFMLWDPTCHQRNPKTAADVERFLRNIDSPWERQYLFIWGHSHEFRTEEDWQEIERLYQTIGNNDKIWYATNAEVYRYLAALHGLQVSVDETVFYNPAAVDVWVERDDKDILYIPTGQTVCFPKTE